MIPGTRRRTGRYYNSNGFAVAIVAVIHYDAEDDTVRMWSAYIGGTDQTWHEADAVDWVARMGDMLRPADAHHYFPDLPMELYRDL